MKNEKQEKGFSGVLLNFLETTPEKAEVVELYRYNDDLYMLLDERFPAGEVLFQPSDNPDFARILSVRTKVLLGYAQRVAKNVPRTYHGQGMRIYSVEDYL